MADLGTDLSCVQDLPDEMPDVSGRTCLAQAIARRYITARGRLIDDPNYGFDLTGYVNDDLSPTDIATIQAAAESEALKDERVLSADIAITLTKAGLLLVTCSLQDGAGPFQLVLSVSEVTVTILAVGQ